MFKRNIANFITIIRITGAIALIFLEPLSLPFFLVYGLCGLSDAFDGLVARKLGISSSLGAALDSVSDLLFYGVMAAKIFPTMARLLTLIEWIIILVPVGLHIIAYVICFFKFNKFGAIHTYANKVLGLLVFVFPFFLIGEIELLYGLYIYIGGVFALYSAIEMNLIYIISKEYNENNKSIFLIKRNAKQSSEDKEKAEN